MNNLTKTALRLVGSTTLRNAFGGKRDFTRTLWHLSKNKTMNGLVAGSYKPSLSCSCGCGLKHIHTKGTLSYVASFQ